MKSIHQNSVESYDEHKSSGKARSFRIKILGVLSRHDTPLTDREIMNILGEVDVNNIRPEITRMKQEGILVECGKITCQHTGKTVRLSTTKERYLQNA